MANFDADSVTYLTQRDAAEIDDTLMGPLGFTVDQLMELAGLSVAISISEVYKPSEYSRVLAICGPGNNGGDGLVAARHLHHFGYKPFVCYPKRTPKPLYAGLVTQLEALSIPFLSVEELPSDLSNDFDVVIDAIFGFSFHGSPRPPFDDLIQRLVYLHNNQIGQKRSVIISVDIPSGWHVEEGDVDGAGIKPDMLVSLTAPKLGAKKFGGPHHFLGGRFVPPAIAEKYKLILPSYPGTSMCVRIGKPPQIDISALRENYISPEFLEEQVEADPINQFHKWFDDALVAGLKEPNAMALSTVGKDGKPSSRMVLLKGFDNNGFVWYTNYESRKARELSENPRASLLFYWDGLNRHDGFHVIAAHTDSPCLKLKPKTASCKCNYSMVNVQTYGAGLWYTWFDRDLSVAGRVILRTAHNSYVHKLVKVDRPILRIPTLAIHLDRTVNQDGFKPNLETHLLPLLSIKPEDTSLESKEKNSALSSKPYHHPLLLQVLSDELNCDVDDIVNIELNVCDTQPSCLGGGNNEFIFSGRLDNLASSYCALRALIDSCESPGNLASAHAIRMVALFDNEEVGSGSVQGAGAPTMFQAMRRIVGDLTNSYVGEGSFERTIRQSFLVSADMAHGVHPNFMDKHEELHRPELQKGLVIKHNANQRYATSGITSFLFKEVAKIHNLPTQEFAVRNDMGCGSTIGPILASGVGIRTVDCGIAQLSMHSIREICGKEDIDIAYKHFKAFYQSFSSVDKMLTVDI